MALTEQDFRIFIQHNSDSDKIIPSKAAQECYNQHLAECERIAELAFNAARELPKDEYVRETKKRPFEYEIYQDYKDSLKP